MYFFMSYVVFVEAVGYASLLTEALLATPQLVKNYQSKSTLGLSQSMVLLWAAGDLFKLGYFLFKAVPIQFVVCGVIQITVDSLILAQISIYSPSRRRNLSRDEYKCTESLTRHSEGKSKAWSTTQSNCMRGRERYWWWNSLHLLRYHLCFIFASCVDDGRWLRWLCTLSLSPLLSLKRAYAHSGERMKNEKSWETQNAMPLMAGSVIQVTNFTLKMTRLSTLRVQ